MPPSPDLEHFTSDRLLRRAQLQRENARLTTKASELKAHVDQIEAATAERNKRRSALSFLSKELLFGAFPKLSAKGKGGGWRGEKERRERRKDGKGSLSSDRNTSPSLTTSPSRRIEGRYGGTGGVHRRGTRGGGKTREEGGGDGGAGESGQYGGGAGSIVPAGFVLNLLAEDEWEEGEGGGRNMNEILLSTRLPRVGGGDGGGDDSRSSTGGRAGKDDAAASRRTQEGRRKARTPLSDLGARGRRGNRRRLEVKTSMERLRRLTASARVIAKERGLDFDVTWMLAGDRSNGSGSGSGSRSERGGGRVNPRRRLESEFSKALRVLSVVGGSLGNVETGDGTGDETGDPESPPMLSLDASWEGGEHAGHAGHAGHVGEGETLETTEEQKGDEGVGKEAE
jgi:hypothetical protein